MLYNTFRVLGNHTVLPVSHLSWRVNTGTLRNILVLTFSIVFNKLHMRNSALYYKTGFVLDDFAQLQANVSVLSMFKVSWAA